MLALSQSKIAFTSFSCKKKSYMFNLVFSAIFIKRTKHLSDAKKRTSCLSRFQRLSLFSWLGFLKSKLVLNARASKIKKRNRFIRFYLGFTHMIFNFCLKSRWIKLKKRRYLLLTRANYEHISMLSKLSIIKPTHLFHTRGLKISGYKKIKRLSKKISQVDKAKFL